MATLYQKHRGLRGAAFWNHQTPLERLYFVLEHSNLFWSMGLISKGEIEVGNELSEASKEYIVEREEQPIFTSIHLKKNVKDQYHRDKLKTALRAVFLIPKRVRKGSKSIRNQLAIG